MLLRPSGSVVFLAMGSIAFPDPRASPNEWTAPARKLEVVRANDNRVPGGKLRDGVLTITLETRAGIWHPDGDDDPGLEIVAFAEKGRLPQAPGPLIRVPQGTEIRATIRNSLPNDTLVVHGLHAHAPPPDTAHDTVQVAPGKSRKVRFMADAPGTFLYWAAPAGSRFPLFKDHAHLAGALIVDPAGVKLPADRILVLSEWTDSIRPDGIPSALRAVLAINGKSWPHTERLSYDVGDTARWRVINASIVLHPMHLHGFYFGVRSRGDIWHDTVYANGAERHVATEKLLPFTTMSLTWVPERSGNWIFHCHLTAHFQPHRYLGQLPRTESAVPVHNANHARTQMGGLVVGIHVWPTPAEVVHAEPATRRHLRLLVRADSGGTAAEPALGFVLQTGDKEPPPSFGLQPAPPIVITRDEPVSIFVVNQTEITTAVHWHGIELESYFDGVAGFGGNQQRITPAIAPGDSFEARFTPPRAGTFIYHTHMDELRQQPAGLNGPLIVLEPGQTYDPVADLTLLLGTPRRVQDRVKPTVNGRLIPDTLRMRTGTDYRIRLINITTNGPNIRVVLKADSSAVEWRAIAKDGYDLPPARAVARRNPQPISIGETYDFELRPQTRGALRLEVLAGSGALLTTVPILVR